MCLMIKMKRKLCDYQVILINGSKFHCLLFLNDTFLSDVIYLPRLAKGFEKKY